MSEASPGEPAEAPETNPGTDAPPEGAAPEAEGGEVDIASLPPAAQEYIRELREEAKGYRKAHEPFKRAFDHFNQTEQEYLLHMVDNLGVDQPVGAQAMYDLGRQLLGIEEAAEEAASDPDEIAEAEKAGMSEADYRRMVQEEMEQAQRIAAVYDETRAVGFDPDSDEATVLWDMAVSLNATDLSVVAKLADEYMRSNPEQFPDYVPKNFGEPEAEPEPEPEPKSPRFPTTAAAPTGIAGTNAEEPKPPPRVDSDEMRERVRRRIAASSQPG